MLSRSQIIGFPIVLIHFEHPRGGQPLYKGHNSWVYIVPKVSFVQRLDCTTNLKLQTERRMSYELQTANCTPQYLSKKKEKSCLCEARTHDLHVTAWCSTNDTMSNSFYSVFIVLIIYSQQVSIFMKQPCSTHNRFSSAKKKKLFMWGSNSRPWRYQHACDIYPKRKEVVFLRFKFTTFTLQHDALPHRSWPRMYVPWGQKETNF